MMDSGESIIAAILKKYHLDRLSTWPWCTLLWVGTAASLVGMAICLPVGWDLAVYRQTMQDLRDRLDPYAVQQARQLAEHARGNIYYIYAYPPLTLRFLRIANRIPSIAGLVLYWLIYAAGFGCQLWAGYQLALPSERRILRYLLPLVVFFPGFMPNEVILCGNLVIPIYGAVLAAGILGWKKNRWGWFYLAVLAASLFKLPLLVMLAIPLLMGKSQLFRSVSAAGAGVALFVGQKFIWPKEFLEYLRSVEMLRLMGNSAGHLWMFGFSAAGVFAQILQAIGKPFETPGMLFFLVYGSALFLVLMYFAQQHRLERIEDHNWMTVLWLGIFLLSPRILQYDALAATVPMFLLVLRGWKNGVARWIVIASLTATVGALAANQDGLEIASAMWILLFSGIYRLHQQSRLAAVPKTGLAEEQIHSEQLTVQSAD